MFGRTRCALATLLLTAACGPTPEQLSHPWDGLADALQFTATGDGQVDEAEPAKSFGELASLEALGAPSRKVSYVRFSVTGLDRPVASAKLYLFSINGTEDGPGLFPVAADWSEEGLTWNARPGHSGMPLDDRGIMATTAWVQFDVTPHVRANDELSFALVSDSFDEVAFYSREVPVEGLQPRLVVELRSGPRTPPD
jgi:hypothetical protein